MVQVNSKQPRKQRNALRKVKNHQVGKLFTVPLEETLQAQYGIKRLTVRVNDTVRIMKGEFEGLEGKVLTINKLKRRVTVEEVTLQKKSGQNYFVPISVSNLLITKLETKSSKGKTIDKWRQQIIDRKAKLEEIGLQGPKKGGK